MPVLAVTKVYALAVNAGFSPSTAITMTAIAGAESGYNSDVVNTANSNGTHDVGLFQINSVHGYSDADMVDPVKNAAAAKRIYDSQGLAAWSTWAASGPAPFRSQLDAANRAAGVVAFGGKQPSQAQLDQFIQRSGGDAGLVTTESLGSTIGAGVASLSPLEQLGKIAKFLSDPSWWKRLGIGFGGVILLLVALLVLLSESKGVQSVTKVAKVAAL